MKINGINPVEEVRAIEDQLQNTNKLVSLLSKSVLFLSLLVLLLSMLMMVHIMYHAFSQ